MPRSLQIPPRPDLQVASWLLPPLPGNWGVSIHKQHGGKSARLKSIDASISHMKKEQLNDCANWDDHSILYIDIYSWCGQTDWCSDWNMHVCEKYSHCARKDKSRNRKRVGKAEKRARMISLWLVVWQFMKLDSSIHVRLCACVNGRGHCFAEGSQVDTDTNG